MKKSNFTWLFVASALSLLFLFGRGRAQTSGCVVEGVIMDLNYAVIPNIDIELAGPKTYTTRSASDGTFRFTDIPDGEYTLRPGPHYAREYWRPVCDMRKLQLSPSRGQHMQHIDLVLRPTSN